MADNLDKLNQDLSRQQEDLKEKTAFLSEKIKDMGKESYLSEKDLKVYLQELKKLTETYKLERKQREIQNKLLQEATKTERENISALQKQIQEAKKPQGFWQKLENTLAGTSDSKDSFEQMMRVRQRFSGIESILSGNIGSGINQLAGSFKSLSRIMGGPYYLALQTVVSGLIQFDKHLKEVNKSVLGQTGGYSSPYLYASSADKQRVLNENRQYMRDLYMIPQEQEILGSRTANFSLYRRINDSEDINKGLTYNRAALQSMGIDASTADRLTTGLMRTEGLNANQSNVFIARMVKNIQEKGNKLILPEKQIIEETLKGFDANKKFNLSMEWVNRQVIKFNNALENGTRSMDDFAAMQKSFYGGETGQLAGLANILAQNAISTGADIPTELLNNLNNPFALKMLMSDPQIMKKLGPALQATAKNMTIQSGQAGNELAEQGYLGDLLSKLFKVNVSRQAVIDLQKSGYDFEKAGLLGTGGSISISKKSEDQAQIDQEAEQFRKDVQQYQKDVTDFLSKFWSNMGEFKDDLLLGYKQQREEQNKMAIQSAQLLQEGKISIFDFIALNPNLTSFNS